MPIKPIALPHDGVANLVLLARRERFGALDRLIDEWSAGVNRFDRPGEVLLGTFEEQLVGVGGLNIDPFAGDPEVGRLRHLYVHPAWRRRGIGSALVQTLLRHGRNHFRRVRLRTNDDSAARFYEALGFVRSVEPNVTHVDGSVVYS